MRADPTHDEGRPGERAALNVNFGDLFRIDDLARRAELQRRTKLRRDLHRVADRLEPFDRAGAALARAWALEVAA